MTRKLRILAAIFAVAVVPQTNACQCGEISPHEAFLDATVVFQGRAVDVQEASALRNVWLFVENLTRIRKAERWETTGTTIRFDVTRAWRGPVRKSITIFTSRSCGYDFTEGTEYVVYAKCRDGGCFTSACSRDAPMTKAGDDLMFLKTVPAIRLMQ